MRWCRGEQNVYNHRQTVDALWAAQPVNSQLLKSNCPEPLHRKVVIQTKFLGPGRDVWFSRGSFIYAAPLSVFVKHMQPPSLNAQKRVTPATLPTMADLTQEPTHANESARFVTKTSRVVTKPRQIWLTCPFKSVFFSTPPHTGSQDCAPGGHQESEVVLQLGSVIHTTIAGVQEDPALLT